MRGKVVTVFGGSGFIGRHLIRRLAQRGATIRVPTRNREATYHLRPLGEVGQIVAMPIAIQQGSISRLIDDADYVVNLTGILHGNFQRVHVELPTLIAQAIAKDGIRPFVHVSAIGADPNSRSVYARTKAAGEAAVRDAVPSSVIVRPSILFGPEDQFLNKFATMSRFAPALPLIGGGTTRFQPVFVGNVADAILAGLDGKASSDVIYELGGPAIYSFRDLLLYVLKLTRRRRPLVNLPWGVAEMQARFFELLPEPPLTRDQLVQLRHDNVVHPGQPGLSDLGIMPTPLETIAPGYLTKAQDPLYPEVA